jgi:hypothetical protein
MVAFIGCVVVKQRVLVKLLSIQKARRQYNLDFLCMFLPHFGELKVPAGLLLRGWHSGGGGVFGH